MYRGHLAGNQCIRGFALKPAGSRRYGIYRMFDALTDKFNSVFKSLSGRGKITESNVADAMREVRKALLEADVNYNVAKQFCKDVKEAAVGAEVVKSLHPGQVMVKIVSDQLTQLMGPVDSKIYYVAPGPTVVMMAGLQGSGKTTTAGKLAKYIREKNAKKPLLVAVDLQRPAAIEQLCTLGEQLDIAVYKEDGVKDAVPQGLLRYYLLRIPRYGVQSLRCR